MSAIIYNRQGYRIFTTPINKGSKAKFTLMQEDYVTLVFSSDAPIPFSLGDNYTNKDLGKRYEIIDLPNPKYNKNTGGYDYELRMDAYYWKWRNKIFKYFNLNPDGTTTSNETSWHITATPDVVLNILIRNLNDYHYVYYAGGQSFIYDLSTLENASEAKLVSFDNTNMIDALNAIAEAWQCEWWVTNNIIHFGKCEYGDNYVPLHTLSNGDAIANVDEMSQSGNRATYATRIFAYGSDRNLPYNYRQTENNDVVNAVVQKRLMLPEDKPHIDAYRYVSGERVYIGEPGYENGTEMPQEEAIEGSITIDSVYPRSTVTITEVDTKEITDTIVNENGSETTEKWTRYRIKLSFDSQFKEKYILGKTLRISFESGLLNGMDFDVVFNPDKVDEDSADSQWFEIGRNEDYGRKLPDDVLMPKKGDSVVLYNWNIALMPTDDLDFISNAENELYEEAAKELKKMMIDPNNYTCKMMSDVMLGYDLNTRTANPDKALTLDIGQRVLLLNDAYFENGERKSRIIGYEYNLDLLWDSPTFIVGESASVGRLNALESKVENLTIKGIPSSGNGGGNNIYIIGSNDITKASDRNVYSALRTDRSFARKDMDDTIQEIWSFYKHLQSNGFNSGVLGNGWYLGYEKFNEKGEGTNSYLEVDTAKFRKKAIFDTLEIKHVSHVGGELILSPAGATISRVSESTYFYRCYFRNDDGTDATTNQFAVGDLIMCKTFNINGRQRYYWRRCMSKGTSTDGMAYVDLSKTIYDTTTTNAVPEECDAIVVVGNATDTARSNAIVISSYATGAPSISLYQGINTFELPDSKMPIRISPSGNKFTGEFYIQILADDGTQQIMSLAEFTEQRISLGVNELLKGDNAVPYVELGSAIGIGLASDGLYGRTYELDEDVVKQWKEGDAITFAFTFNPYLDRNDVTNLYIAGSGVLAYMFDALNLSDNIIEGTNTISGSITCKMTLEQAIAEAEEYGDEDQSLSMTISAKGQHAQGQLTMANGFSAELKRTGVDIERGYITLDARNTTIKDGDKELAIFTTDADGNAKLSTELIDAEAIEAQRLSTKGTTTTSTDGTAIKKDFIKIEDNAMEVFNANGDLKVRVHSGTLASSSSVTTEVTYNTMRGTLPRLNNGTSITYTNRFRIGNYNKLYKFTPVSGNIALKVRQTTGPTELIGAPQMKIDVILYYSSTATTLEAMEGNVVATNTLNWSQYATGTINLPFEIPIEPRTLPAGNYYLVVRFNTSFPHYDSNIELYGVNPGITGTVVTQVQEIASDGWHYQYGDATTPKYMKGNGTAFEVLFAPYGLRISTTGIQITKNGGNSWTSL